MANTAIILINYKNPKITLECVESLIRLQSSDYTIYVVDNAADENTKGEFERSILFQYIKYIPSKDNLGFAGGNNIAIQRALDDGCDYIMLLNNDTVVDSSFLDEMKRYCNSKTVVVPKIYYFDEPSVLWYAGGIINWISGDTHHTGAGKVDDGSYDKVEKVEFASGCCILMNKNVIEKVGMLDESYFMYYEDTDFCARLKKETIDIVYVPTAKIWHKVGASSSGEYSKFTAYYMAKNRLKFISKYSHNNLQRAYLRTIASGITDSRKLKLGILLLGVLGGALILQSSVFDKYMQIDKIEGGGSITGRLAMYAYYFNGFMQHPIMGQGFIKPINSALTTLLYGPYGFYYLEDVGIVGCLFTFGLVGVFLFLTFITKGMKTIISGYKDRSIFSDSVVLGVFMFLVFTMPTLFLFDYARNGFLMFVLLFMTPKSERN